MSGCFWGGTESGRIYMDTRNLHMQFFNNILKTGIESTRAKEFQCFATLLKGFDGWNMIFTGPASVSTGWAVPVNVASLFQKKLHHWTLSDISFCCT